MGKIMCEYSREIIEKPTSGSCRHMWYCTKYKQYCLKQCKKDRNTKSKK